MRDDWVQYNLRQFYKRLKVLKQWLAEADEIHDPVRQATRRQTLKFEIKETEKHIDEWMRRA